VSSKMNQQRRPGLPQSRRESVAEQTSKTAMALIEADAERTRAKIERLRALRLANQIGNQKALDWTNED
jgi:hypothetical protein